MPKSKMPKKSLVIFGKDTGVEVLSAARQADKGDAGEVRWWAEAED